ncbi:MAG: C25 family peptidase propeptide domain-containing protein, partial [bacterium]
MQKKVQVLGVVLLCLLFCFTLAQAEWIAADATGQQAPEVRLLSHSPAATVLELTLHGFYSQELMEAGVLYQQISFGDNAALREVGLPELPVIARLVGIPDRSGVAVSVAVLEVQTFSGFRVYPAQELTVDGEEPLPFTINREFYSQDQYYPEETALASEPQIWRDVRLTRLEVRPV